MGSYRNWTYVNSNKKEDFEHVKLGSITLTLLEQYDLEHFGRVWEEDKPGYDPNWRSYYE